MPRSLVVPAPETSSALDAVGVVASVIADLGDAGVAKARNGLGDLGARAFSAILPRRRHASVGTALNTHSTSSQPNQPDGRTDEDLLVAHRAGDGRALRTLVERYRGELHGFLTRLVGSRAGADDVFQEAFLQVHLSADSFDSERRFKPWLYTIAANKGRDFLRRQKRRAAASLDAPTANGSEGGLIDLLAGESAPPSLPLEASDEAALVKQVVDGMPPHFREILLLSYFQKLNYSQISDSLAIPLGTVKSRLHAAVACFAESWKLTCARRGVQLPGDIRRGPPSPKANDRAPQSGRTPDHGDQHGARKGEDA